MKQLLIFLAALSLSSNLWAQHTEKTDTLKKELLLERDFVPTTGQAKKTFFSPLETAETVKKLTPLQFAKNSYDVTMFLHSTVFEPLYISHAAEKPSHSIHLRLFGGYPLTRGANLGAYLPIKKENTLDIFLNHLSRKNNPREEVAHNNPQLETYDTDFGLSYTDKFDLRTLKLGGTIYHHLQSYHGYLNHSLSQDFTQRKNPLYNRGGVKLSFALTPAPIKPLSSWEYALKGDISYTTQELPIITEEEEYKKGSDYRYNLNGIDLFFSGNFSYGKRTGNFSFNGGFFFQTTNTISKTESTLSFKKNPAILSVTPSLNYEGDLFTFTLGANAQLLNGFSRFFHLSPHFNGRLNASDLISLFINVDGGASAVLFRDLYLHNRYATPFFLNNATELADYKGAIGLEIGNIGGFYTSISGGFERYSDFYEWGVHYGRSPLTPLLFKPVQVGKSNRGFLEISTRFLGYKALSLSANYRLSHSVLPNVSHRYPYGRPIWQINVDGRYSITPQLSVASNVLILGDIPTPTFVTPDATVSTNDRFRSIFDVNLRLSYQPFSWFGLSLIGENLVNQEESIWVTYKRPGRTLLAAFTFTF